MDEYALNVLKLVASELRLLNGMTAAREMYGKSYFSLGIGEKIAVDQAVQGMVSGNFHAVTPEYFAGPEIKRGGFSPEVRWVGSYLNRLGWSAQALQMCS